MIRRADRADIPRLKEIRDSVRENRLRPGEIITGYRVPVPLASVRSTYVKVRERASYEYALVSAAAAVSMDAGRIAAARLALGQVAQKPWRLDNAEKGLVGLELRREEIAPLIEAEMATARPLGQNAYKVRLAANAALRALLTAGGQP